MGKTRAKTPATLSLITRIVRFDYASALRSNRYWHGNDPVTTHFFNALQALFPDGERFFMDSARDVRDEIGADAFSRLLRAYLERYRWRIASPVDFLALTNEVVGRDMSGMFRRWLEGRE